jgi:hypothetical protein
MEQIDEGMKCAKRLQRIVNGAVSGDSTTVFASLKESLKDGQRK